MSTIRSRQIGIGEPQRAASVQQLDEAETVPVRPDFVWSNTGVPRLVVDAKYKAEKPSGFPQADLYQMLA
jgi:5-methylcytosine-specific restriction enzyme subunit McrC